MLFGQTPFLSGSRIKKGLKISLKKDLILLLYGLSCFYATFPSGDFSAFTYLTIKTNFLSRYLNKAQIAHFQQTVMASENTVFETPLTYACVRFHYYKTYLIPKRRKYCNVKWTQKSYVKNIM